LESFEICCLNNWFTVILAIDDDEEDDDDDEDDLDVDKDGDNDVIVFFVYGFLALPSLFILGALNIFLGLMIRSGLDVDVIDVGGDVDVCVVGVEVVCVDVGDFEVAAIVAS
jgi:hypothetical protein